MRHNMWTEITRPKYERAGRRYASDLADAEWRLIEPYMPAVKRLGRPRETDLRAIVDAILYIARTGCQWRLLPKDFPPFTSVYNGPNLREALAKFGDWTIEIVTRATGLRAFASSRADGLSSEPSPGSIETA